MEHSREISKWLQLIRKDGVGPVAFSRLLGYFGNIDDIMGASSSQLQKVEEIGEKTAFQIRNPKNTFDPDAELALADKLGICIINLHDVRYPVLLKSIYDPPPVLYIKGTISRSDNLAVAIVGSRRCSTYGREQASRFAHFLAASGFTIVSGLARGIDTAAHHGALAAGGRTIAVQGRGLAGVFPVENKKLAETISLSGAIVSELPLNYEPLAENFPPRNRIIAGLTQATIVIEASQRSGALITAGAALEYNREVMAVPGKIDSPLSKGTHKLLKQGARLVDSIEDVMDALGFIGDQLKNHAASAQAEATQRVESKLDKKMTLRLSPTEDSILNCLDHEEVHIDQIVNASGLNPGQVSSALVSLQLKGIVTQLPGSFFKKRC